MGENELVAVYLAKDDKALSAYMFLPLKYQNILSFLFFPKKGFRTKAGSVSVWDWGL